MPGGAVRIDVVLERVMKNLGLKRRLKEARIALEWETIAGKKIAAHSRPSAVRQGILLVNVDSSVWLAELSTFFKETLLRKVRDEMADSDIRDIYFRLGDTGDV